MRAFISEVTAQRARPLHVDPWPVPPSTNQADRYIITMHTPPEPSTPPDRAVNAGFSDQGSHRSARIVRDMFAATMKATCAALVLAVGSQGCRDHADTLPVGNTLPSAATSAPVAAPMPTAADIADGEAIALAMAKAEAAKDGSIVVKGLPFVPPQAKWEARIRAGGNPIIVAMAGKVTVSPFFEPRPGIWEYIVTQEGGAFSLPIESDTLPVASEVQTNLPGGRQVTTPTVHATLAATGEIADVGVTPWALPEPGHTLDMDLDICMAAEVGVTGLTLDKAVHGPVGGAPGLLAAVSGKVAAVPYRGLLWKIYLPDSKLLLSYSVYSATPSDLRTAGEMMLRMFTVGPQP